ncbi:hypothetical protein [Actinoplanes sp. RD1]|uniref:hypothetical protein n=1 Tax=Actinoplanes sp. RD1 TaxID=3064538 RepID=UPI0027418429|nr:hypothetical protein [Actinoplanes sp. RD1]
MNPFPRQAAVNLELPAGEVPGALPTVERDAIARLLRLCRRYRDETGLSPGSRQGRAVAVHGEHGSGKTYALLVALAEVFRADAPRRAPFALYGRADAPDPVQLYRKLLHRSTRSELQDLVAQAFVSYAAESFADERGRPMSADDWHKLDATPDGVRTAILRGELSWTSVVSHQEEDLARVEGSGTSFERVIRALFDAEAADDAHRWLTGAELPAAALGRLGAASNINDLQHVRLALHTLAALARRARRPFVLAIDQAEVFLLNPDGRLEPAHVGLLRELLDKVTAESGLVMAAMNEVVWRVLPRDVKQRCGPSEIAMTGLDPGEARELLRVYLGHTGPDDGAGARPFLPDAVRSLLARSGGNIRRFLQAAHVAYAAAQQPGPIAAADVEKALTAEATAVAPGESAVRVMVQRVLTELPYVVRRDDGSGDYELADADGTVLRVGVHGPMWTGGEATALLDSLSARQPGEPLQAPLVLAIAGYVSPDAAGRLSRAAEVLVATSELFEEDFRDLAVRLAGSRAEKAPAGPLNDQLDQVRDEIKLLVDARERDSSDLTFRLQALLAQQEEHRREDRLRTARQEWAEERQRVAEAVSEARKSREKTEMDEVRALHLEARHRRERRAQAATISGLLGGFAVFLTLSLQSGMFEKLSSVVALISVVAGGLTTVLTQLRSLRYDEPVTVPDDLARLARRAAEHSRPLTARLADADPYQRFTAAFEAERGRPHASAEALLDAAEAEPAGLVRRQLVAACLARRPEGAAQVMARELDAAARSLAVQKLAGHPELDDASPFRRAPRSLSVLAALHGTDLHRDGVIGRFLVQAGEGPLVRPGDDPQLMLAAAFFADDERTLLRAVARLPEKDLRRTADSLSPHTGEGLGSWYWLERAELIGELYVFLRWALFLIGRGLDAGDS